MSQNILLLVSIILVLAVFFLIVMLIDGNRFHVVEYQLYSHKVKKEHCYVVLSDLHNKEYGTKNQKLLKKIRECGPEGILIAGDILTAKPGKDYEPALQLIEALAAEYPVYYGMGNHETRLFLYPEVYQTMGPDYERKLKKVQVKLLRNESVECEDHIKITGLELERKYYKRFQKTFMEPDYLRDTLGEAGEDCYEILLAHNPDYFEEYADWGADLVLSGHVHGGMMRLPFLGGVVSPAFTFFPKYDGGLFRQKNSTMLLSRGLGMHTIPIRIFNPGELLVVKLSPKGEQEEQTKAFV